MMEQRFQPEEEKATALTPADSQALPSQAVGPMDREEVNTLLATLTAQAGRRRRYQTIAHVFGLISLVMLLSGLGAYLMSNLVNGYWAKTSVNLADWGEAWHLGDGSFTIGGGWITISLGLVVGSVLAGLATRAQMRTTGKLAAFRDTRAAGPLAEALELGDPNARAVAASALCSLLPHLEASDATLIEPAQHACLRRALGAGNADLSLAILKAFEQIGDSKDLPFVEKLAAGKGRARRDARVRDAAGACLPFLRVRAEQERASQTLLRSADSPGEAAGVLLRPAQGTSDADPEVLLRPEYPGGHTS